MVSVTVLLAVASGFWGTAAPGVANRNCPDGVRYNVKSAVEMVHREPAARAEATLGSCVITFRAGWRARVTDRRACEIVLHEYGHAALNLGHDAGGIMSAGANAPTPGACMPFRNI